MSLTSIDLLNLFVRSPGELLYFLSVIALTLATLFMALGQRSRHSSDRSAQRYTLAVFGVAVAWLLLMAGALYTLLSDQDAVEILPPLERAINVVTILLLGWAFLTADHSRWRGVSNVVLLLLILVTIIGYIVTGIRWPSLTTQVDFNLSIFGIVWTFASAVLAVIGILLTILYFRIIADAPLKLVFFIVLLLGYGGTLYQIGQGQLIGDYAGVTRLALLVALPVMPAVVYRTIIGNLVTMRSQAVPVVRQKQLDEPKKTAPLSPPPAASSPMERESVQLLRALGVMLEESTPVTVPERIVLAAIEVLKADIGVLFKLQDANYVDVVYAYDRPMAQTIAGMALNLDNQPTLVNAIERQVQRPLYPDRNIEELHDFYTRLDIDQIGPVYFQPLIHSGVLISILAVGLPYSKRELIDSEMELLRGIAVIASSLMSLSLAAQDASLMAEERAIQAMIQGITPDDLEDDQTLSAHQEMQASLELARDQIKQLSHQVMELKIELDDERSRVANALGDSEEGLSISQRIVVLTQEQQTLRDERDRLAARLQDAEAMLVGATSSDNNAVLERLTGGLQQEKEALQAERDSLQSQLNEIRATEGLLPEDVQTLIKRMSDERSRLELERDHLQAKVGDIEAQLDVLGIEGGVSGLMQLISQLFEQNTRLETSNAALKRERDTLRDSSGQMGGATADQDKERETRILTLQTELLQLAADREAALKQRDKYRVDRDEMVAKQESIKQHRARLLAQVAGYEIELEESHQESTRLRTEIQKLADERSQLMSEQDRLRAEKQALETERDQLLARADGDRDRLQQLGEAGVGSLTRMIEDISRQRDQLERELNETRMQIATVENQLGVLEVKSDASDVAYQPQNPELLMGVVQELRTPITSISGYVDLLLGESAGILGEMQRKFLQRVSANVMRLTSMLDDLIHVTALDTGDFVLTPESIDVLALIEESITNASGQFREKGLTVHLNLDDDLPLIRADRDAIHQIIGQLLMNAYLVSPANGEIFITARRDQIKLPRNGRREELTDSLFVSVEDRGGGIAAEDEARVFARKYKADNPLIQGLGDTGVGLSIAKALVETHGGKLWLEARENVGSSFCFALPLMTPLQTANEE